MYILRNNILLYTNHVIHLDILVFESPDPTGLMPGPNHQQVENQIFGSSPFEQPGIRVHLRTSQFGMLALYPFAAFLDWIVIILAISRSSVVIMLEWISLQPLIQSTLLLNGPNLSLYIRFKFQAQPGPVTTTNPQMKQSYHYTFQVSAMIRRLKTGEKKLSFQLFLIHH